MTKIKFRSNERFLEGNILYPRKIKEKIPGILFIHGWTSSKVKDTDYSKSLAKMGYICFAFDLSGHGESEGNLEKITFRHFLEDCISSYDYFSKLKEVDSENIHVVGSSFGGYLAPLLTEKRKVKSLVLRAPQNYLDEGFDRSKISLQSIHLREWRKKEMDRNETKSLRALHKFDREVLLIEVEHDEYVTPQTIKNYMNAVKDKSKLHYKFVKGLHHSIKTKEDKKKYVDLLINWFRDKKLN